MIEHKEDEKGQDEAVTTSILLYKYIPNTYMDTGWLSLLKNLEKKNRFITNLEGIASNSFFTSLEVTV